MRGKSRTIFNKDSGLDYMRDHFPLQLAMHLSRPLELSHERPNDIFNVYYDDLVADPLAQMRKIYRWLGDEWTDSTEDGMQGLVERKSAGPLWASISIRSSNGDSADGISFPISRITSGCIPLQLQRRFENGEGSFRSDR